jgi:hypothetical protein
VVLGFYLIADNLLPYLFAAAEGGVAHGAHIGGFVAGVAVAWLADRRGTVARGADGIDAVDGAADLDAAIDAGRFAEAARAYLSQPANATRNRLTPEQGLALASWLRRAGHPESALVVLRRLLRDGTHAHWLARIHLALAVVLLEDLDQPTPAYQHLLAVLDLDADPQTVAAAREALAMVARRQKRSFGWTT